MVPHLPRVGLGSDIHPIQPGRPCRLAGLDWPGVDGCAGDSDSDVAAHAAGDALLSAAGLGDLGTHFGTGRPEWRDAAGTTLLAEVARLVRGAGYEIGNVAVQVIAHDPKLGPRRVEAEEGLSAAVVAPLAVAATTRWRVGL